MRTIDLLTVIAYLITLADYIYLVPTVGANFITMIRARTLPWAALFTFLYLLFEANRIAASIYYRYLIGAGDTSPTPVSDWISTSAIGTAFALTCLCFLWGTGNFDRGIELPPKRRKW